MNLKKIPLYVIWFWHLCRDMSWCDFYLLIIYLSTLLLLDYTNNYEKQH